MRMGGNIRVPGRTAVIRVERLTGTCVKATDLRAGAARHRGVCAVGRTEVEAIHYIERG